MEHHKKIQQAADYIKSTIPEPGPLIGLVLGSGLGNLAGILEKPIILSVSDIPHWPVPSVPGHSGFLIYGFVERTPVLIQQGRVHFYEGHSIQKVVFPVRVMHRLGIKILIVTNAAGGLNPQFKPGDLMIVTDQINLMFTNPLIGYPISLPEEQFPDMSEPYDLELINLTKSAGKDLNIPLTDGVLVANQGPCYETRAEVRMLQQLGGDAVCMSTIPEVITGVQMGLRILGISCIANSSTGLAPEKLNHEEVKTSAEKAQSKLIPLVKEILRRIVVQIGS